MLTFTRRATTTLLRRPLARSKYTLPDLSYDYNAVRRPFHGGWMGMRSDSS